MIVLKQKQINIVLVEPKGTINLGSVARLCENFGVNELRLVSPKCDPNDSEATRMAVRGQKILKQSTIYSSLLEAISDCPRVVATCGRKDHGEIPINSPKEALQWAISSKVDVPIAIIFGREDRGLTNQELLLANKVLTLQTSPSYPSLNLSHSVAIVLHELNRFNGKESKSTISSSHNPALPIQIDDFIEDAKELLLEIEFLLDHTSQARMNKLKMLLQRAEVRSEEIQLMRGVIRQARWALNKKDSTNP